MPEPLANQPFTFPPSSFLPQLGDGDVSPFAGMAAMFGGGIPSIDELPVEKTYCSACEAIAPRIRILGFSAVICPECCKVRVDGPK